jgi:hypothetical protein
MLGAAGAFFLAVIFWPPTQCAVDPSCAKEMARDDPWWHTVIVLAVLIVPGLVATLRWLQSRRVINGA